MTTKTIGYLLVFLTFFIFISSCANKVLIDKQLSEGIYDCKIGEKKLILVIQESAEEKLSGYYLHNRNNAIEDSHEITFVFDNDDFQIISDEYEGVFSGQISENDMIGNLKSTKGKWFFRFWKNNQKVNFIKRPEITTSTISRYKNLMFNKVSIKEDLVYGHALGYWTETPYLDDPYIEILGRGMINFFKAPKILDLKLDLYQPKNDSLKLRPLIVLSHGGGFYIGNKQSETEQILANTFTQRGYVVASIDYRMGFKMNQLSIERGGYRTLQDVHAALRYLSHNAKKFGIDPEQVYVAGTSAGAIASLNIAFMDNDERPKKSFKIMNRNDLGPIESSGNNFTDQFSIKAVGSMWGALTDTSVIDGNEQIPVISFHGTYDNIVPIGHDYPFQNTFMFNRLLMNKIYGSKTIHKRLTHLNIENKFIPFIGKGHEPQLDNFKTINKLMDTIKKELIDFFFKQMVAKVEIDPTQLNINKNAEITPLEFDIIDGELVQLEIIGGFQITPNRKETSVIWIKDAPVHQLTVVTTNHFQAIGTKKVSFNLIE